MSDHYQDIRDAINSQIAQLTSGTSEIVDFIERNFSDGWQDSPVVGRNDNRPIRGTGENDFIIGKEGDDIIDGEAGMDFIVGGDVESSDSSLDFGRGETTDIIEGGPGNDIIIGGEGNDYLFGGEGNDLIIGDRAEITLSPSHRVAFNTDIGEDGISENDVIVGGDGDDLIYGGEGANVIHGGNGNDVIVSHGDNDALHGGGGEDTFDLSNAGGGQTSRVDIWDFEKDQNDRIKISGDDGILYFIKKEMPELFSSLEEVLIFDNEINHVVTMNDYTLYVHDVVDLEFALDADGLFIV